jgi:hypothetical protein
LDRLRRENRELKQANEILMLASSEEPRNHQRDMEAARITL